jgi:hypothetical protein
MVGVKRYTLFLQCPCGYEFGSEAITGSSAFGNAQGTHNIKGAPLAAEGIDDHRAPILELVVVDADHQ